MKKLYEIALSYAHKDKDIADMIGNELKDIFADGFFMDELCPEELANADPFREKLMDIFERSNYAVILYSENYRDGMFTSVEMKKILEKEEKKRNSRCFIINIDDCSDIEKQMQNCTYIVLQTHDSETGGQTVDWSKVQEKIHKIVQDQIKKCMMIHTVEKKMRQRNKGTYSLRIQSMCPKGNEFRWDKECDWNILGKKFIDPEDGKRLKWNTSWQDYWNNIKKEFEEIKTNLGSMPELKRRIYLNCHLSIAYKLGQIYGDLRQASGNRNLILVSSNRTQNTEFVFNSTIHDKRIEDFYNESDGNNKNAADIVCILSIKPREQGNILDTVKQYLERQGKEYCKICLFQQKMEISDADTLESMAEYLRERIMKARTGSDCKVHLFPDTTAPLMFALGARSVFPGTVQLYEYIYLKDTYEESLTN